MNYSSLSPLVDRTGVILIDAGGAPLAADGDGMVYQLNPETGPMPMGELSEDAGGQILIMPLNTDTTDTTERPVTVGPAGRRRAHLRGRIAHHEGRLRSLSNAGAAAGDVRTTCHAGRIEKLKSQLAQVNNGMTQNEEKSSDRNDTGTAGLGDFGDWWVRNRKYFVGGAIGAGGALLARSAIDPDGYVGRLIRTGSVNDPASADAERTAAAQALQQAQIERDAAVARADEMVRQSATRSAPNNPNTSPRPMLAGFPAMNPTMLLVLGGVALGALFLLKRK